ncbi:MAG TPA: RNase H family protein [Candidatus Acidoferrales bacterium]|nr:RNase H family protein [Candidatus Acidoferrales bacterium]
MAFDPHAVKIHIDGNCWDNPGGSGGFAVRVEFGCDIERDDELVEYRGYFETSSNRMELRACICAHQWAYNHIDELGGRILVLTDSTYVCNSYSWAIGWSQNDYCNSDGRPMKNEDLLRELMTARRKLARLVRVEVKLIPRRSDLGAKEVDRVAKMAGRMPSHVDRGFPKGKIGRPKNNIKGGAKLYPAGGQTLFIRPYKSDYVRRSIQLFRFEVWDEAKQMFADKFEVYASPEIGNQLHRQNVYHVRMNNLPRYPQIVEILMAMKEAEFIAQKDSACP